MSFLDKVKGYIAKDKIPNYFLALNVTDDQVEAVIWGFLQNKTEILGTSVKNYQNKEDMLLIAGEAIDQAGSQSGVDVSEVIFGLPQDWIEGEKIISPYSEILKRLAKDLELEPLAFVSNIQAVSHLVSRQELSSPSAVFLEVNRKKIYASLIANGKILEAKSASFYGENFIGSLEGIFKDMKSERPFPSRIILYGSLDLEKLKEEIESHNWGEDKTSNEPPFFIHLPKVDILKRGILGKAVAVAGAADLGYEKERFTFESDGQKAQIGQPILKEEEQIPKEPVGELEEEDNFGFVTGRDVLKDESGANVEPGENIEGEGEPKYAQAGIEKAEDYLMVGEEPGVIEKEAISVKNTFLGWTEKILDLFQGRRKIGFAVLGGLILVLILIFLTYYFLPRAKVELEVVAQTLPKEAQINASPKASEINIDNGTIPAEIVSTRVSDSKKGVASGKKSVGEKAHGKVTIFNKTSAPRTFSSGSQITGPSNLTFTLEGDVTVASRSATIEGITYGKEDVEVTAKQIGPDSNLPANTDFTISDFDSSLYSARNSENFSGGTSKDVTVVSQKDLDQLKEALTSDFLTKAKDEISKKLSGDQKLIDGAIATEVISANFDKKADDEASVVNLSMEIEFRGTVYKEKDLQEVLKSLVGQSVPSDLKLSDEAAQTETSDVKLSDSGDLTFSAKLSLNLIPKYNEDEIKKNLAGKKTDKAYEYLNSLPEIASAKISLSPPLPFLNSLPKIEGNIKIIVSSKK